VGRGSSIERNWPCSYEGHLSPLIPLHLTAIKLPSTDHANRAKHSKPTRELIMFIQLEIVKGRFTALASSSITNRLLYH
jgi:hypothetical protein